MRKLCLLLAMVALATALAFAGAQRETPTARTPDEPYFNETGLPITSQPVTMTVLFPRRTWHGDFEGMWFIEELERRTNIALRFTLVDFSGWEERKNLAFASGDYPDIFLDGIQKVDDMTFGVQQGILVDVADLVYEHSPQMLQIFEDFQLYERLITAPGGAIYSIPAVNAVERDQIESRPFINRQWIENLGLQMPRTLDELYEVLYAFKHGDPNSTGQADTIPWSSRYTHADNGPEALVMSALGFVSRRHDLVDGEYVYVPVQPEYREYLRFMNRLYGEGLLDPEYFTQDTATLNAKITQRRVGYMAANPAGLIAGEDFREYTQPSALTSAWNQSPMWPEKSPEGRDWGVFAMTRRNPHPKAAIRLVDYFFTQEGTRMVRTGPEYGTPGVNGGWELYYDDDGNLQNRLHFPGFDGFFAFRGQHSIMQAPYFSGDDITFIVIGRDPRNQFLTDAVFDSGLLDVRRPPYPDIYFTPEEIDRLAAIEIDLENYVQEMDARFITGGRSLDRDWDAYIETIERIGLSEMISIRQAAYDRWE